MCLSDEGKIQFGLFDNKYTVELAQRRNGQVRAHVDLGQCVLQGKSLNFFANLKSNINFSVQEWRLGTNYFGKRCESSTRLEINQDCSTALTHRTFVRRNKFIFAGVFSLNLQTFQLRRYDGVVGFENGNHDIYLKHQSDNDGDELKLGDLTLTAQRKVNDKVTVAAEV